MPDPREVAAARASFIHHREIAITALKAVFTDLARHDESVVKAFEGDLLEFSKMLNDVLCWDD